MIKGSDRIRRFFDLLIAPLVMRHEVKEFWDGSPVKMLRGHLLLAKRQLPTDIISPPFVEFLTVSPVMKVKEIAIVVGPTQALNGMGTSYNKTETGVPD